MKLRLISLGGILLVFGLVGGCKKAELPQSQAPDSREAASLQPSTSTPAPNTAADSRPTATSPIALRLKWPVGSRSVYRMDLNQQSTNQIPQLPKPIQQAVAMSMTHALTVLKETPGGGREVELEYLANEMEVKMGDQVIMAFDSKEQSADAAVQNPLAGPFRKMVGSKVLMQLNSEGKLEKVLNLDEWLQTLAGDAQGPAKEMINQQFSENYFRQVTDFGTGLPPKAVAVGESWPNRMDLPAPGMGKIALDSTVTLKGMEDREGHHCAVLQTTGTFKGGGEAASPMGNMTIEGGKINGTSWFDPELGALVESVVDQTMRFKGEMPGGAGANSPAPQFTSDIRQTVRMQLVERTAADR